MRVRSGLSIAIVAYTTANTGEHVKDGQATNSLGATKDSGTSSNSNFAVTDDVEC